MCGDLQEMSTEKAVFWIYRVTSIQDYISPETLLVTITVDMNVYDSNIFIENDD